jgi:TPR repeat protein
MRWEIAFWRPNPLIANIAAIYDDRERWMKRMSARRIFAVFCAAWAAGFGAPSAAQVAVPENYGQALAWYEKAAAKGDADAQYLLARALEDGLGRAADAKGAAKWYEAAALGGHADAQFSIGQLYLDGRGVARDQAKAAKWFAAAAAQGRIRAQYNLAVMLEGGRGVTRDLARAADWYDKAAKAGLGEAQLALAMLYLRGAGVARAPETALMWLEIAAARGARVPPQIRAHVARAVEPAEREKARKLAREWLALHPRAQPAKAGPESMPPPSFMPKPPPPGR